MNFTVNTEVCTRCGICMAECPTGLLVMTENGPQPDRGGCLKCGHCVAVCPTMALDYDMTPRAEQPVLPNQTTLSPDEAELFLRRRRSIRVYKDMPVPREDLVRLLNVARMAPTATNSQGISFRVIQNKETLKKISVAVLNWMHMMGKKNARMRLYARGADMCVKRGQDFILHDAPTLILAVTSEKMFDRGRDSGHFCLSYAELFAPTLGLGSCWSGFVEYCAQYGWKELLDLLDIPDGQKVAGAIMVGYPKYKYRNLVERRPLDVSFDEDVL